MESGDRFGDYVVIQRLAAGGMAQVYLARRSGVGGFSKPVAMKVILPQHAANREFIEMFLDEARLAVCLTHAHIAQVIDLGEVGGQYFIAMEFAHGKDLQQISRKTRKSGRLLPLPYAAKIISQIAEGLYYAHTKTDNQGQPLGVVHRDISPHNIILTFDGMAKLIDFGIAKATVTYKEEEEGVLKGKFSYMSPEQIRGMPVDPRSDIFALGIVLWEVCTGANLYRESSELLTMEAILRKPVPKPRELRGDMPPELESIILKALAKRTVDRFQNAFEMHQALEGYLNRSGWNVGTPHLSEFMRKLFPDDFQSIRDVLETERQKAEVEGSVQAEQENFVAWEPYDGGSQEAPVGKPEPGVGEAVVSVRPATQPNLPPSPAPAPQSDKPSTPWMMIAVLVLLVLLLGTGSVIIFMLSGDSDTPDGPSTPSTVTVRGSLILDSEPQGAQIFINGDPVGRTPKEVADLPLAEDLSLKFDLDGYEVYSLPVRLSSDKSKATIKAELKPK